MNTLGFAVVEFGPEIPNVPSSTGAVVAAFLNPVAMSQAGNLNLHLTYSRALSRKALSTVFMRCGSACGPVIVPVFKTGGWQAILSSVGSTPTRFRQYLSITYIASVLESLLVPHFKSEFLLPRLQ